MNDEIFNKMGFFKHDGYEFCGMVVKNNGDLEFTVINHYFKSNDDYLLISGYIDDKKVSFVILNYSSYYSSAYNREETFLIHSLFVGECFENFDDIKFKKISIKINNISSAMMKLSSFEHKYVGKTKKPYSPLLIQPQDDIVVFCDDFKFKIRINYFYENLRKLGNGECANFKEDIRIVIEYDKFQKIHRITKDSLIIENLFSFITGKSKIIEINSLDDELEYIDLILPIVSDEILKNRQHPSAIQLNESNIGNIIKKWFDNYFQLNYLYNLYFSLDRSNLNPPTLLITYSRILESYHRQRYEKDNVYLYTRLKELFNDLERYDFFNKILERYVGEEDKISKFSGIVKDNRNYYTHYNKKKDTVIDGKELMELNDGLKLIIDLILLKEFEFSIDEINEITSKSNNFRFTNYFSWEY